MSAFYLDTSVLVAALGNEQHTRAVQDWLSDCQAGELYISDWVITEFSSALALKLRTGQLQPEHRSECLATFARLVEQSLIVVPVTSANYRSAARLADQHQTGLRAGDALHLAVCADHGMRLVTLDNTLAAAARTNAIPALAAEALNPEPADPSNAEGKSTTDHSFVEESPHKIADRFVVVQPGRIRVSRRL